MKLTQDALRIILSGLLVLGPATVGCAQSAEEGEGLKPNALPKTAKEVLVDFEKSQKGKAPDGFSTALTGGGEPGAWVVTDDASSPEGAKVLAQTSADKTNKRYPVCVYDDLKAKDVDLSVHFKPVSGTVDQAAGLVWRYQDKENYYVVRANALENNVVLYKTENGVRSDLKLKGKSGGYGMKAQVPKGEWSTLRVTAVGNTFEVFVNDKKLYEVEDMTFTGAGKVGVWTKADSVTHFDQLKVASLDQEKK